MIPKSYNPILQTKYQVHDSKCTHKSNCAMTCTTPRSQWKNTKLLESATNETEENELQNKAKQIQTE